MSSRANDDGGAVTGRTVGLLAGFTAGSSLLGLATAIAMAGPEIVVAVWGSSLVADMVFILGSAGTAFVGFSLWRMGRSAASIAWGAFMTWTVYAMSFLLMGDFSADLSGGGLGDVFGFVGRLGWPGIAFGASAPGAWAAYQRKAELAARVPVTVSPDASGPARPPP